MEADSNENGILSELFCEGAIEVSEGLKQFVLKSME